MNQGPTAALSERAARGDRAAFEALLALHGRTILAVARAHAANPSDAEEVFQESTMRAWKDLQYLQNHERFVAWVCSITQNVARDLARRSRVRQARELPDVAERAPSDASEGARRALIVAVESLPAPLREVIELFYFSNLTYREIAEIIGKSAPTVNLRLADAREQLRKSLKDHTEIP